MLDRHKERHYRYELLQVKETKRNVYLNVIWNNLSSHDILVSDILRTL